MLTNSLFAAFLSDIVAKLRKRFFALVLLSAICAITDSLRIVVAFLLVPFIGIPLESASTGFLTRAQELFGYFNLPYTLTTVSVFVILVFLFQTVLSLFQNWYQGSYTYYYTLLWRQQLFKAVGQANWRYFLDASRGELVNALSNETGRLASATTKFLTFLSNLLVALAYVIAASLVSFKATALMVLVGFTVIIFNSLFLKRLMRHARLIVNGNAQMMQMTQEFMNNIKAVKSSPLGLSVDTLVARPLRSIFRSERVGYMIPNASRIVAELFIMLALVTAIIFVSSSADSGTSADGLLVLALFLRAYSKITMTMTSAQQMYVLLPAFEHVSQIHSKAITHEEPQWETGLLPSPDALANGIDFINVCVSHERTLALKNINLHLPPRSIIALVGPSGAGKTTLVDALLRLVDFDSGEISIKGQSITVFNMQSWRSCFGYVSQEPTLVNGTLADNIKLFKPDATNDEVRLAAQMANAQEFIEALPEGYQTTVGEMGLKLSGGQRQRIALARALINDPPALILDEATSALDTESEDKVMHAIHEIAATKTIVLIAHRLSTVRKADLIVVLDKGEIIEQGDWKSLIHHKGRLAELWQRMEPSPLQ